MLPVPILDHLPKVLVEEGGELLLAFCGKMDSILLSLGADAKGLSDLRDPASVPAQFLNALGQMYAANIFPSDSEPIKRNKLANAIESHKERGLWGPTKAIIDAITGFSSSIYVGLYADWPVRIKDDAEFLVGLEWSLRGGGPDGIIRVSFGNEAIIAGNVYIDLGSSTLTPEVVAAVVAEIRSAWLPAYFRVFLGYVTAGAFTVYAGGTI